MHTCHINLDPHVTMSRIKLTSNMNPQQGLYLYICTVKSVKHIKYLYESISKIQ